MAHRRRTSIHSSQVSDSLSSRQSQPLHRLRLARRHSDLRQAPLFHLACQSALGVPGPPAWLQSNQPLRKPSSQVLCDSLDLHSIHLQGLPRSWLGLRSRHAQTAVNDKENRVPDLDSLILPPMRQPIRTCNSGQVLCDQVSLPAGPNCSRRWEGRIPFEPCSSGKLKGLPEPSEHLTQISLSPAHKSLDGGVFSLARVGASQTKDNVHAARATSPGHRPLSFSMDVGGLVVKLKALETNDSLKSGEALRPMLEPLPADAMCPGAPRLSDALSMIPLDPGSDTDDDQLMVLDLKSPMTHHQNSPLAEVTEAYTGLQGGWSPPLETFCPAMEEMSSVELPSPISSDTQRSGVVNSSKAFTESDGVLGPNQKQRSLPMPATQLPQATLGPPSKPDCKRPYTFDFQSNRVHQPKFVLQRSERQSVIATKPPLRI